MLIKNAILSALVTVALILTVALGIAFFRSDLTWTSWLEITWFVSMGSTFLGYLLRGSSASSSHPEMDMAMRKATLDPDTFEAIDNQDGLRGIAFGWVVMLSSLVVFGASLAILVNLYNT